MALKQRLTYSQQQLELQWTTGQRRTYWLVWRALTAFLFLLSLLLVFWQWEEGMRWLRILSVAMATLAARLFFQPYTTCFYLCPHHIRIRQNTGITSKERSIPLRPADQVVFKRVRGRALVSWRAILQTDDGETQLFYLNEPVFSSLDTEIRALQAAIAQVLRGDNT